jgi:hypothetical protein
MVVVGEVGDEDRELAKRITYAIIYGGYAWLIDLQKVCLSS